MLIPNQVNNYAIWLGGNRFLGMADVTLPNLTNLTDELKGAGLGGTINMPVAGHFDDWTVTYNFHTITPESCELLRQDGVLVEARVGIQYMETSQHRLEIGAWRFVMRCFPRGFDLGRLEVGTKETNSIEMGLSYIKALFNGAEQFEIDKVNMIARVKGTDYSAAIKIGNRSMKVVKLSKPTQINGSEISEIKLDLESLRGRDMMELESGFKKFYRGEFFPSLPMEPRFQLWVAGHVCGINHADLADVTAPDYYAICTEVQNFLLSAG